MVGNLKHDRTLMKTDGSYDGDFRGSRDISTPFFFSTWLLGLGGQEVERTYGTDPTPLIGNAWYFPGICKTVHS